MRSLIERMEKYGGLNRKGLELIRKTKVMRFKKGDGRMTRKWKRMEIEEVKEFDYLRYYRLQRNGGQEAYVRERIRKVAVAT